MSIIIFLFIEGFVLQIILNGLYKIVFYIIAAGGGGAAFASPDGAGGGAAAGVAASAFGSGAFAFFSSFLSPAPSIFEASAAVGKSALIVALLKGARFFFSFRNQLLKPPTYHF